MVQGADAVVLTKADLVSQAEREVFSRAVLEVNPDCTLIAVNGLTGEGLGPLCAWLGARSGLELLDLERLRTPLPRGSCLLCSGGL
jgi:Ni2+-binding GTPase involved in maturation of urease and hydrogenase